MTEVASIAQYQVVSACFPVKLIEATATWHSQSQAHLDTGPSSAALFLIPNGLRAYAFYAVCN